MSEVALSADGVPIHYEVHGQGTPALVFVHGWCCDRNYWHRQVEHFAQQYAVVTLDLAGHGESGQQRGTWSMPAFGQDVVAVIEKLSLAQVVLVGHSMAGPVILEAALRIPNRVIGLVGVDTFRNLERSWTKEQIEAFVAPFRLNFPAACGAFVRSNMFVPTSEAALVAAIVTAMIATSPHVGIGAVEALFSHAAAVRAGLQALQVPVHTINHEYHPAAHEPAGHYYDVTDREAALWRSGGGHAGRGALCHAGRPRHVQPAARGNGSAMASGSGPGVACFSAQKAATNLSAALDDSRRRMIPYAARPLDYHPS